MCGLILAVLIRYAVLFQILRVYESRYIALFVFSGSIEKLLKAFLI